MRISEFTEVAPARVTPEIEEFCAAVSPGQTPVFVPVRPVPGAEINMCTANVDRQVGAHGGRAVYGWTIWRSAALLHAEFHVNWQDPAGGLVDVTPKVDGERAILFLPDPTQRWAGRFVPSRRKARRADPALTRLVDAMDESDGIRAKYRTGESPTPVDYLRTARLAAETGGLMRGLRRAWAADRRGTSAAGREAKKKADRKRRKRDRRRGR